MRTSRQARIESVKSARKFKAAHDRRYFSNPQNRSNYQKVTNRAVFQGQLRLYANLCTHFNTYMSDEFEPLKLQSVFPSSNFVVRLIVLYLNLNLNLNLNIIMSAKSWNDITPTLNMIITSAFRYKPPVTK